jgi:hypothetical protein
MRMHACRMHYVRKPKNGECEKPRRGGPGLFQFRSERGDGAAATDALFLFVPVQRAARPSVPR